MLWIPEKLQEFPWRFQVRNSNVVPTPILFTFQPESSRIYLELTLFFLVDAELTLQI